MLLNACSKTTSEHASRVYDGASLKPLVFTPPSPHCEVCIIIPVRDEAQNLTTTLQAVAHQTDLGGRPFDRERYEIILLANNCTDDSAAIARRFAKQHSTLALHVVEVTLPPSEAHIGRVRQMLMDEAYRRLKTLDCPRTAIASTDGDTRVAPTWVAAILQEIDLGADAVGGRILTDPMSRAALDPSTRMYFLREVGYLSLIAELESYLDPDPYDCWPRHYQHFGASLAVTPQMYERAGGLPVVRTAEDVAFYKSLLRVDAHFRHSLAVHAVTSARQVGRAQSGLANLLNQWAEMGRQQQPFLVESAQSVEVRLQVRRGLRVLWQQLQANHQPTANLIAMLAGNLGVTTGWLANALEHSQTFGLLLEHIECQQSLGAWSKLPSRKVEIGQAISELRLRLHRLRRSGQRLLDPLKEVKPVFLLTLAP